MKFFYTILGARPQFIKAKALSACLANPDTQFGDVQERIVHTGQHFDANMSDVFFSELQLPTPHVHLGIAGGNHGDMTARMLIALENLFIADRPDAVLVYGDTNSTLAGALAASKLHIPLLHVEAGLRSFNMQMPEEINRILTDKMAARLYCPTETAVQNLASEGQRKGVMNTGDVMYDVAIAMADRSKSECRILQRLQLTGEDFILSTIHRAENTDTREILSEILQGLAKIAETHKMVLPLHPRTRNKIAEFNLSSCLKSIKVIDPVSYLDMIALESGAQTIITDSGGVQKEAYFFGTPCLTIRDQTEWTETINSGWNTLVAADKEAITTAFNNLVLPPARPSLYGDGNAAHKIASDLISFIRD